jgi:hypothetical protein
MDPYMYGAVDGPLAGDVLVISPTNAAAGAAAEIPPPPSAAFRESVASSSSSALDLRHLEEDRPITSTPAAAAERDELLAPIRDSGFRRAGFLFPALFSGSWHSG